MQPATRRLRSLARGFVASSSHLRSPIACSPASRTEGSPLRWDKASEAWRPKRPDDPESDGEDEIAFSGRAPEKDLCLEILTEKDAWFHDSVKLSNGGPFTQCVSVWGVPIYATAGVPAPKLGHAAQVLAQWLDNDEDGQPDCPMVLERLVADDAALIMTATSEEMEDVGFSQFGRTSLGNVQGLYASETDPEDGSFDASIEEILHLVTQKGFSRVFAELDDSKATTGNVLSDAMDAARGGRFPGGFPVEHYPGEAWYSYDDVTCTYGCQKTEYLYWLLTSYLGGQGGGIGSARHEQIKHEWKLSTRELLLNGDGEGHGPDLLGVAMLEDKRYCLPLLKCPDGQYRGPTASR